MGKIRKYDEECFFEKNKRFHLFKSLLQKNGEAQIMPLVAGRLVLFDSQRHGCTEITNLKSLIIFYDHIKANLRYVLKNDENTFF